MKKVLVAMLVLGFTSAHAQDQDNSTKHKIKKDAKEAGHAVKKEATVVGNKTAEIASKGESKVVDKVYEGKAGPDGQTIYINKKSKYYWVDSKGHRHYVTQDELTDKQS